MTDETVFTPGEDKELVDVQQLRNKLIQKLTNNGEEVPAKGQVFLLGLLDGADRQTLSRAKLRIDKKKEENNQNVVKLVGEALRSINAKTYRPPASIADRTVPDHLDTRTYVPGELEIGNDPVQVAQLIGS